MKPVRRREVVRHYQDVFALSERRACQARGFGRASHRYRSRRNPEVELRMQLKELAEARVRYGYRRLHILLQREGWHVNHKRLYRLYCEEGLSIRTRSPKRRRSSRYRAGRTQANGANDVWAMDFMSDRLFDGRPFRILTIVDCHTREALASAARTNFRAYQVIDELDRLARARGKPRSIRVDNGPEFASRLLDQWAFLNECRTRLLTTRKAHGQRIHRGVQQPAQTGVPQRFLVPVDGGCAPAHHLMEGRLQ